MDDETSIPMILRKKIPKKFEEIKNGDYTFDDYYYPVHLYLSENNIRVEESGSEISQFLKGKNVLVTGGTGFLGKLLVEKLIRSCKDIGKVYIIIRQKKGKDFQVRTKEFLDNWAFYKLAEIYPDFRKKIVALSGDFAEEDLGLSEESRQIIYENVNIIYHAAATIRFDEKIKTAVDINIKGTREIVRIAKRCKNFDVFTYISTAYSNCHMKRIGEQLYQPVMDPDLLIQVTDKTPEPILARITPGLLGPLPNTYAFTKQIAEHVVGQEALGIPACVYRPSIVIASVKEPIRSWIDNIYGPVGLIQGAVIGLLHIMIGNPEGRADLVPVDYVINSCIASSYKTAKDRSLSDIPVFNYTTSDTNALLWKHLVLCTYQGWKVGSEKLLWKYFFRFTNNKYIFRTLHFLLEIIPAHIIDFMAVRAGKKAMLVKIHEKIGKFVDVLSYFTLGEWDFDRTNTVNLWNSLNETDKKNFAFDMDSLDWLHYFDTYLITLREFLLLENLDNHDAGAAVIRRNAMLHYGTVLILNVLSVYFLLNTIFFFVPVGIVSITIYYLYDYYMSVENYIKSKGRK